MYDYFLDMALSIFCLQSISSFLFVVKWITQRCNWSVCMYCRCTFVMKDGNRFHFQMFSQHCSHCYFISPFFVWRAFAHLHTFPCSHSIFHTIGFGWHEKKRLLSFRHSLNCWDKRKSWIELGVFSKVGFIKVVFEKVLRLLTSFFAFLGAEGIKEYAIANKSQDELLFGDRAIFQDKSLETDIRLMPESEY